jgi:hypothetical protein
MLWEADTWCRVSALYLFAAVELQAPGADHQVSDECTDGSLKSVVQLGPTERQMPFIISLVVTTVPQASSSHKPNRAHTTSTIIDTLFQY